MAGVGHFKSAHFNQIMQLKYKNKYKKIKRVIKNYVFENAALCDQIAQIQQDILVIKEEREFLLQKIIETNDPEVEKLRRHIQNQPPPNPDGTLVNIPGKRGPKKRINPDGTPIPKTKKVQDKTQKVEELILDDEGRPVLPITCNSVTIIAIGEIVGENTNFHTENWIYPVGYIATRVYAHPKEPDRKCTFTCKILDNSGTPQFQIIPDADYDHVFFGESANICHLGLLNTLINNSKTTNLPIRAQGELFFGLGLSPVKMILNSNSNIKKCQNFKGFKLDSLVSDIETNDPTLNFYALQKFVGMGATFQVTDVKDEPPEDLLE
ncbi:transforming growth factor beta regulator 1 [Condylostylus longicornis]|uniref:transforming growth factor beta regulator 1 n=1 Tax=Condylostylus longicornis TaxID=2530218 RepID=UPI00244E482E|nr:transforming growth factor beta regulator 1 [Condylostylus longicornis]